MAIERLIGFVPGGCARGLSAPRNPFYPVPGGLFVAVALLGLAACKTAEPAAPPPPPPPPPVNMADYEDFDPAAYPEALPPRSEVQHDVPERLLGGREERPVARTVQGFRIQIFSTQDKPVADRRFEQASSWWRAQQQAGTIDKGQEDVPPVYLVYRQPYYRVRVGNFATRNEALQVLRLIQQEFPEAFIAPDTVTITR